MLMTFEEFARQSLECKYEHLYSDQTRCEYCLTINLSEGLPCPLVMEAYEKYKAQFTDTDAIFIMMQAND